MRTTLAIIMSAIPAILGLGPGTETRSPMAAVVLGGLIISTILSLLVVPAFYLWLAPYTRSPDELAHELDRMAAETPPVEA